MDRVSAAAVAVHAGEPDLPDDLWCLARYGLLLLSCLPDRRIEGTPLLVDGQRLEGVLDMRTKLNVEKLVGAATRMQCADQPGDRDSERADSIPDTHALHRNLGVAAFEAPLKDTCQWGTRLGTQL